ncbi:MAG TPA: hypothetical protein VMT11_20210 [Myxococcaceae bacterium]|nr:hypothetical protein [Myxococcaceae bacterium]
MHLVATVRQPKDVDAAVSALVTAAGMTRAEARMRLAPEPPALLARLPPDGAEALVRALDGTGLAALALDEAVPTDADRLQARSFGFEPGGMRVTARSGATLTVPWDAVRVVLRGVRTSRTTSEHTEASRSFALGRAVLTGGLVMTKKTTSTVQDTQEASEQFVLVHADGGERVILAELELEFSGLGALLQPARAANLGVMAQELRRRAPGAFHDERLLRLGRRALPFVLGGEHAVHAGSTAVRRSDTRASVDVIAEVLDRAVRAGLLG